MKPILRRLRAALLARLPELAAAHARTAKLETKAKDDERCIVNLVAALRQANARLMVLEEVLVQVLTERELQRGARAAQEETVH